MLLNKKIQSLKNGFTEIELLLVVAIIGILAATILISVNTAKIRAQDVAALNALTSTLPGVRICLESFDRIGSPNESTDSLCYSAGTQSTERWPDISRSGWGTNTGGDLSYGDGDTSDFKWCNPNNSLGPTLVDCGPYDDSSCGGDKFNGSTCFFVTLPGKSLACQSQSGCRLYQ